MTINNSGTERLQRRMARGAAFLGSEVAVMGGAMSWVSERHLVAAISNAGGFGVIACGAMTPELLDAEIAGTRALTSMPFGVNLITMHPQLFDLIAVCAKHEVGHVVLAGGLPPANSLDAIKGHGAKLICFAPALSLAKKLIRSGVDALVVEGMEAGGHIGPVSTSVLAQEILPEVAEQVPVFVAGGIGRGEAIAGYLDMGAAGVQLGTRFVCATESIASRVQESIYPSLGARRGGERADRSAVAGNSSASTQERRLRAIHRKAARGGASARRRPGRNGRGAAPDRTLLGGSPQARRYRR